MFEQNLWILSLNVLVPLLKYCSMMVSFSEGLLLSEKVGLDPNTLVEVISERETKII
jgi:glyoxylate/succinic semialdehyde reductase